MIKTYWHDSFHSEAARWLSTRKQRDVVERARGMLAFQPITFDEARAWAHIAQFHDPAYVSAVRDGNPRRLAESQGFVWSPAFATSVVRIWETYVRAALDTIATRESCLVPVSGAHHADRDGGSGFCTFNYLVGAAATALEATAVTRVAIVDLDAHEGDGTLAMTRQTPGICLFDICGGRWSNLPTTERDWVFEARTRVDYWRALKHFPAFLDTFRPDLVLYQAGMDPHEHDHVGSIPGVSTMFLRERDRIVFRECQRRGIPWVVNLAGGYQEDGTTVGLHVQTITVMQEVLDGRLAGVA